MGGASGYPSMIPNPGGGYPGMPPAQSRMGVDPLEYDRFI